MSYGDTGWERPWIRKGKDGLDRDEGVRGRADASADDIP